MALPPSDSRWIASHYSDEFDEAHAKGMAVREFLGAAIPGAGVGCAFARPMLDMLVKDGTNGPFPEGSLTEDYELGLEVHALGGKGRYLRVRTNEGRLIATRAYFPDTLEQSVRQKTRWTHGIALQGWVRLGWSGSLAQRWMTLRDRRGPLAALLLGIAYITMALAMATHLAADMGIVAPQPTSPVLGWLLLATFVGLVWRILLRAVFTGREYGLMQGLYDIPRVVVSNLITIMSGRRALAAYLRTLRGAPMVWDKTTHRAHPASAKLMEKAA